MILATRVVLIIWLFSIRRGTPTTSTTSTTVASTAAPSPVGTTYNYYLSNETNCDNATNEECELRIVTMFQMFCQESSCDFYEIVSDEGNCSVIEAAESATQENCSAFATCANLNAGINCTCPSGYEEDTAVNAESFCRDTDECLSGSENDCHSLANCMNIPGSYNCTCKNGYEDSGRDKLTGRHCTDINECAETSNCSQHASCRNTPGNYSCECWRGYRDTNPTSPGTVCSEVRQFALKIELDKCTAGESCANKTVEILERYCAEVGSPLCDKYKVVDYNECSFPGEHNCSENARCINVFGSYTCKCNSLYEDLDSDVPGRNCSDRCFNYEGKCYALFLDKQFSPNKAGRHCEKIGGQLANLYSETHWEQLMAFMRENKTSNWGKLSTLILGMTFSGELKQALRYRNGTEVLGKVTWQDGYPVLNGAMTLVVFNVAKDALSVNQYFANYDPAEFESNFLCEMG